MCIRDRIRGMPAARISRAFCCTAATPWEPSSSRTGLTFIPQTVARRSPGTVSAAPCSPFEMAYARHAHRLPAVPYRLIYIGLGSLAIAVIALGIAFGGDGDPIVYEPPLESVSPNPNDAVLRQAIIEVDLEVGYDAQIFVDGFRAPTEEVQFVE